MIIFPSVRRNGDKGGKMDTVAYNKKLGFLKLMANLYADNLRWDKGEASRFVSARRITDKSSREFKLGFASGIQGSQEWGYLMQEKQMSLDLGLLYKDTKTGAIKPYFRNRIMFPYFDLSGNILGFTGRDIGGLSKAKYLNSKESDVFQKSIVMYGFYQSHERIFRRKQVFLVEGNIDVIRMHEHDYAVVGLSSHDISLYQINILKSLYPEIFLIMDGDKAGKSGAERITQQFRDLYKQGQKIRLPRLIELPAGYDPDKFFLEHSDPEDFINEQIWNKHFANPVFKKSNAKFMQKKIEGGSNPELIKQMTDITEVIGNRINLVQSGDNYTARCPFHEERTASFVVSKSKQIFKCFGCGASGDVFTFLMKYENIGFHQALKMLGGK
jgi:DNA primase catalytic core